MSTNPPRNSDSDGSVADPTQQVLIPLQRATSFYLRKSASDYNQAPPIPQFDNQGSRFFEAAPIALPRIFVSPLALSGPNAIGPSGERRVTSGFGDGRSRDYGDAARVGTRTHHGLDFAAPVGETVFAMADGIVDSVRAQRRNASPLFAPVGKTAWFHSDSEGFVIDGNGKTVLNPGQIGHGGIYIRIIHNGDFTGYFTEYMHLSAVNVAPGQPVNQGDPIASVGTTGGDNGIIKGPHLHMQMAFRETPVNPTFLVPHYHVGSELVKVDGSIPENQAGTAVASINQSKQLTVGEATLVNNTSNQLQALQRHLALQNMPARQIRQMQGDHAKLVATNLGIHAQALEDASAKFKNPPPSVSGGMAFDFTTGVWSPDGKPV